MRNGMRLRRKYIRELHFLTTQHDKYADKENVIWVETVLTFLWRLLLSMEWKVGSDFCEKIIYWNQKLMKKLDLIYLAS